MKKYLGTFIKQLKNFFKIAVVQPETKIKQNCWQEIPTNITGQHVQVTMMLNRRTTTFRHTKEKPTPFLPYVLHHRCKSQANGVPTSRLHYQ